MFKEVKVPFLQLQANKLLNWDSNLVRLNLKCMHLT